jgi:hypothetical protein
MIVHNVARKQISSKSPAPCFTLILHYSNYSSRIDSDNNRPSYVSGHGATTKQQRIGINNDLQKDGPSTTLPNETTDRRGSIIECFDDHQISRQPLGSHTPSLLTQHGSRTLSDYPRQTESNTT